MSSQLVDRKGRLWQERTVIVKKETEGFGFTLSQEMPVFVDKVFGSSSAERAGILEGDRIIKVNGTDVVGHKHNEVVDMIRDSTHVTLTIIGKLSQNGTKTLPPPPPTQTKNENSHGIEISTPRHLQELTQQSLKMMLQKQRKSYETLSVDYSKQSSDKVEKELRDCENIIKILEEEIASKSPAIGAHMQTTSSNIRMLTGKSRSPPQLDEHQLTKKLLGANYSRDDVDVPDGKVVVNRKSITPMESPKPSRSHTFSISNGSLSPTKPWRFQHKMQPSDDSDEDLSDEVASDAGPFSSLQELKGHPAHLAVFLHYLYLTKEPKHLLFYLVASSYQTNCKSLELLKQRGMDIYWTFFLEQSPLPLEVEQSTRQRILHTLETEESENKLKSVFVEVRESLAETIINDLGNYRHKRVIGLAGMFGDHLLSNHMTQQKHIEVVLSTLGPDLKQLLDEKGTSGVIECIKNQAIAACMVTFILDLLATTKTGGKVPSILDRIQSFTRSDNLLKKGSKKKKMMLRNGHNFQLTQFKSPATCDQCGKLLWGVIYHGYQCSLCDINIHRYCCITEMSAECAGQHKPKSARPRKSSILSRKPSLPSMAVTVEDGDGSRWNGVGSSDLNLSRTEEDEDRPLSEALSSPGLECSMESGEPAPVTRRGRSESDPHRNMRVGGSLVIFDNEVSGPESQPPSLAGTKEKIKRTNSEKLPSRPESIERHLSGEGMAWSSEESPLGKQGSLEAIAEGPSSTLPSGNRLAMVDEENMKELLDDEIKDDPPAWAEIARSDVLEGMRRTEIQRQEYIREFVYTERTHLYKLKIMRYMYKIPLQRQGILSAHQTEQLFPSLEELIVFHGGFCSHLKERVGPLHDGIVKTIADVLLQRFDGGAGDRLCHACSIFASNQPKAEKLFKDWRRKNERLRIFIKSTETHPLCHRLSLSDLMPIVWTRLTRYKLLIENIIRSYKKDWDNLDDADKQECEKTETAMGCVQKILVYVNKQVKFSSEQQKLMEVQSKIEFVQMERTQHPIAKLYKTLNLRAENRRLVHEGPLTWRIQHRKVLELYALLFNDILVLLEKHEDKDKYFFRCHTVENISGTKEELSPVIRLQECLLRHAAADRGGRTFLLVNNSNLMKLAQMYEFIAESPKDKKLWEEAIKRAMLGTQDSSFSPELPVSPLGDESLGLSAMTMHLNPREQLNKIDEDMKKLHDDKLRILRAMQGVKAMEPTTQRSESKEDDSSKGIIWATIEQAGDITSAVSHIMVPNPTKTIIADTQHRLTNIIHELQKNLSKLLIMTGGQSLQGSVASIPPLDLDLTSDTLSTGETLEPTTPSSGRISSASGTSQDLGSFLPQEVRSDSEGGSSREVAGSNEMLNIPSPIPEVDEALREDQNMSPDFPSPLSEDEDLPSTLPSATSISSQDTDRGGLAMIVAPPDIFSGDESVTPTPGMESELTGEDSEEASTPKLFDSHFADAMVVEGKVSPLVLHSNKVNGSESEDSPHRQDSQTSSLGSGKLITVQEQTRLLSPPIKNTPRQNEEIITKAPQTNTVPPSNGNVDNEQNNMPPLRNNSSPSPSGSNKVMSVFTSAQHSIKPSVVQTEDSIPSFSLSRRSTNTSLSSEVGSPVSKSPNYEGTDL